MSTKKGAGKSPSSPNPRFILEDGQQVEIAAPDEGQRRRGRPPLNKPKLISVTLQLRHSVNGHYYGPGLVRITEKEAQRFLNVEYEAACKEDSLMRQQAFIIQFRNGVPVRREVPAQRFDDILAREELPMDTMGGR